MSANTSTKHQTWKTIASLGGLLKSTEPDASDTLASIYAIHTDHVGTPQMVTDEAQQIVWQADTTPFGMATIRYAAMMKTGQSNGSANTNTNTKAFEMNLRLPGQVYDAETGLHQNYYRDYDPQLGRYSTPDPIGIEGGINPYSYVNSNPLINIDPLGLYEEDIHFYMTYFLARAAGVDAKRAYIIATGAQYVDDNPDTQPTKPSLLGTVATILFDNAGQQNRLSKYHFTQGVGDDVSSDPATRYLNGTNDNAQLQLLKSAAENAREVGSDCAGDVMFGEYLHAFEDTYGHRKADNTPIQVNGGWGHALQLHSPDHTYNEDFSKYDPETGDYTGGANWKYNEARTLEMEHQVFNRMTALSGNKTNAHSWEEFEPLLKKFNATKESSSNTNAFSSSSEKVNMLNKQLGDDGWKLQFVGLNGTPQTLNLKDKKFGGYDSIRGSDDRKDFLRYKDDGAGHKAGDPFKKDDPLFKGTILP